MADGGGHFPYRFTKIPKGVRLLDELNSERITGHSIAPDPLEPESYNVGTVTFQGKPSFFKQLKNGEGAISSALGEISIDENFFGITPLTHVNNAKADVIAVHGLGGRAFHVWQNSKGSMWLRDFLPVHVPGIQVSIYGYPTRLKGSASRASIQDYTDGFMKAISSIRKTTKNIARPLILIGHSLGCLLIKSAVVDAASLAVPMREIYHALYGIVFFGAPHRGLHNPELDALFEGKPPAYLLADLRPESAILLSLNRYFPAVCKGVRIVSCYETYETLAPALKDPLKPELGFDRSGPLGFQVPRGSACLNWPVDWEAQIPIHADHSEMAKIDDSFGSPYHQIRGEIERIVAKSSEVIQKRQHEIESSQDLLNTCMSLQYEISWHNCWIATATSRLSGSGRAVPTEGDVGLIPYGHPAYPLAAEASWEMERLGQLLQAYLLEPDEVIPTTEHLTNPKIWSFINLPRSLIRADSVGAVGSSSSPQVLDLTSWSARDQSTLAAIVTKLRQLNEALADIDSTTQISSDLVATSEIFKSFDMKPGRLMKLNDRISRPQNHQRSGLVTRIAFRRNYEEFLTKPPRLYSIDAIDRRGTSELSNFRLLSPLQIRQTMQEDAAASLTSTDKSNVLVEWRSYRQAKDRVGQQKAKDQSLRIAADLSIATKPPYLRTLDCIGLVQDWESQQIGLLFQLPDNVDVSVGPISLHACLRRLRVAGKLIALPTLAERLRLARSLSVTIAELHFAGILHRDLHSGNVLLFQDRTTGKVVFTDPYVGGFGISRPEQDESLSLSNSHESFQDYRHPELRAGSSPPTFRRRYDIYSLGLMLLEIGLWKPISSLSRGESPVETATKWLGVARFNLSHHLGRLYAEAAADCLSFDRPWLKDEEMMDDERHRDARFEQDDERPMDYLMLFVEKVIRRLEACQCQM